MMIFFWQLVFFSLCWFVFAVWRYRQNTGSGMGQAMTMGLDWLMFSLVAGAAVMCRLWPHWWLFFPAAAGFYLLRSPLTHLLDGLFER